MNAALKRFSAPRETWPDLVLWLDDFLAIGGLMALQGLGVRAPDDVPGHRAELESIANSQN